MQVKSGAEERFRSLRKLKRPSLTPGEKVLYLYSTSLTTMIEVELFEKEIQLTDKWKKCPE